MPRYGFVHVVEEEAEPVVGPLPTCPILVSPVSGTTVDDDTSVTITWNSLYGVTQWHVYVWETGDDMPETPTAVVNNALTADVTGLTASTQYTLQVVGVNVNGESEGCGTRLFTTSVAPIPIPACPSVEIRVNENQPEDGTNIVVAWQTVIYGVGYRVYQDDVVIVDTSDFPYPDVNPGTQVELFINDLIPGQTYEFRVTAYNGSGESSGCVAEEYDVPVVEVIGWAASTLSAGLTLTNGDRDVSALPAGNLNQSVKSDPGVGNLLYMEVYLVGDSYANEASWPYFPDPISVAVCTPTANLSNGTLDFLATGAYGMQISGVYQTQTSGGATARYEATVANGSSVRPASVSGSRRRVMVAWNKTGGLAYFGFGGTWIWGNPTGGAAPKTPVTVPASVDLRVCVLNIIQARGSFTAAHLTHAIPAGYTAWDGTT